MKNLAKLKTPDYVIIGHITQDITPDGKTPGGTALYSGLTAHALGMSVGIYTSYSKECNPPLPADIDLVNNESKKTSTFKNIQTQHGRVQYIFSKAKNLDANKIPDPWKKTKILHIGPVANEVALKSLCVSPETLICITPQGCLRQWDDEGKISYKSWQVNDTCLHLADLVVLSIVDVQHNEDDIEKIASHVKILVVTEGAHGARVYWNGDVRRFPAKRVTEIESTGAGDIFATSFFYRYIHTRNPWESARFANQLASNSVTRILLDGIPTREEIHTHQMEILQNR